MLGRRARPLDTALGVEALVGDAGHDGSQLGHLVKYLRRVLVGELILPGKTHLVTHAAGQVAHDVPVGAAVAHRRDGLAHALHAPLAVGKGAVFLRKAGGRQDHIGQLRGFVHENILHHQEVQTAEQLIGAIEVGFTEQGILAGDIHGANSVVPFHGFHHLGYDQTGGVGNTTGGTPGVAEPHQRIGTQTLVTGQRVGQTAGIAATLDVVLAAQRRYS